MFVFCAVDPESLVCGFPTWYINFLKCVPRRSSATSGIVSGTGISSWARHTPIGRMLSGPSYWPIVVSELYAPHVCIYNVTQPMVTSHPYKTPIIVPFTKLC